MKHRKLLVFFLVGLVNVINGSDVSRKEIEAAQLVAELNSQQIIEANKVGLASWNYATNITTNNAKIKTIKLKKHAKFIKQAAKKLLNFDTESFQNETLKRIIKKFTYIGDAMLDPCDFDDLREAVMRMEINYATAKVPNMFNPQELFSLEPEITQIMADRRNPDELKYYWVNWHDLTGTPSKDDFFEYVSLRNKAARANGFVNGAEMWLSAYEDPTFEKQIEGIMKQIQPLYRQYHGYIRHKLHEFYGPKVVDLKKPIPIHLLGNMWGQHWVIEDIVVPYKNKQQLDVTKEMKKQNFTPRKMFEMAEDFFVSINMSVLPDSFWRNSIIEKPNDGRDMVCHASAWDFSINHDVRIKQCTSVTIEDLRTVHHEMGHIEYYLQYSHQPLVFRTGANPGFHEAIGDVLALSVSTNRHLQKVGLLKNFVADKESEINQMVRFGLSKIAFLPFAFAMDKFRWEVFRENVKPHNANCYFWKLREKHGGVEPSIVRTNRDFDITAKYHASADVEYLRYFVSFIIQFQFHKAACIKAGEFQPNNPNKTLNNCDIYQSTEAGNALKSMLAMGASKPWPDALEVMTGERELNASAFLEYFKPLQEWLVKTNKQLGVHIGWEPSEKIDCSR